MRNQSLEALEKVLMKINYKRQLRNVLHSFLMQTITLLNIINVISDSTYDKLEKEIKDKFEEYDKNSDLRELIDYCVTQAFMYDTIVAQLYLNRKKIRNRIQTTENTENKENKEDSNDEIDNTIDSIDLNNQKKDNEKEKGIDDFSIFVNIALAALAILFSIFAVLKTAHAQVVINSATETAGLKLIGVIKNRYTYEIPGDIIEPEKARHNCPEVPGIVSKVEFAEWEGEKRAFLLTTLMDPDEPICVYIYDRKPPSQIDPLNLADLYSKAGFPPFPDFILDMVFGKRPGEKERLRSVVIIKEHPGFGFMINFQQKFADLFKSAKLIVMAISLAAFTVYMAWDLIRQRRQVGFIDPAGVIRRNAVFVLALLIFVFPVPPYGTSPAWLLLEKMVRIGDDIAESIAGKFSEAYVDVRSQAIFRDIMESIKIDNEIIVEKFRGIEELAVVADKFCCAYIDSADKRRECSKTAKQLLDSVKWDYEMFEKSLRDTTQTVGARPWHGYNSALMRYADQVDRIIKANGGPCRIGHAGKGLLDVLKSNIKSLTDEFSRLSRKSDYEEMQKRFSEAKGTLQKFEETGGWLSSPFVYFMLLTPFLEAQKEDETGYVPKAVGARGIKKDFLDYGIHYPMVGWLPPFKQIYDFLRKIVYSEGEDRGLAGGVVKSLISKVKSLIPVSGAAGTVLFAGKAGKGGIEYALLWLSYAIGVIVLNFMAYAVVVMSFLYRYVFYVKEILKHYYTTPFLIFWAVTGQDGRYGRWIGRTVYLMLYPSVLIIGLVITYFMFELVNVLQNLAVDYILWAEADTEGIIGNLSEAIKAYALAAIITATSFILKVYLGWKIIVELPSWFADHFDRSILPTVENTAGEIIGMIRSRVI